jgi:hypothetical protein
MAIFDPTAGSAEFDSVPGLRQAWSDFIAHAFELNLYGSPPDIDLSALDELKRWGKSDVDLRFYSPASMPIVPGSTSKNVFWQALPRSFDDQFGSGSKELFGYLDAPQMLGGVRTRIQDEYCEWSVERDAGGKPVRMRFTSEPPEFYDFLYRDPLGVGKPKTRALLVELYRDRCGTAKIKLSDLENGKGAKKVYNPYNDFNNRFCVHMQQPNNTLFAEVNIAARACILRVKKGKLLTDAQDLIGCGQYGAGERQSDPSIGAAVN